MNTNEDGKTIKLNEIVSPEGLEERVVEELIFRVTMTGGGKFRLYLPMGKDKFDSSRIYDDKVTALKELGGCIMVLGSLMNDAERTIEVLFKNMKKGKE